MIYIIANATEVENVPKIRRHLLDKYQLIIPRKLAALRVLVCFLMILPALFFNDEIYLIVLSGAVLTPVIGFLIPILVDLNYVEQNRLF